MPPGHDAHPGDVALLLVVDGELAGTDAPSRTAAHVRDCAECTERLAAMRRRTARLSALLSESDVPVAPATVADLARWAAERRDGVAPPPRAATRRMARSAGRPAATARAWWSTPGWRIAAAVLLAVGLALSAQPVRAWAARQWARLTSGAPPAAAPTPPEPAAPTAATTVSFVPVVPATGAFTLRLDARPVGGTVTVTTGADARARVVVEGAPGSDAVELLVLPDGVRARNAPGSTARYRVVLPAPTRRLRLEVGPGAAGARTVDVVPGAAREVPLGAR
jgi:hypothetical protein